MLRQKRFSNRTSINHSLNLYANDNMSLISSMQAHSKNGFAIIEPQIYQNKRSGLSQIDNNSNIRKDVLEEKNASKLGHFSIKEKQRKKSMPKFKEQDKLFQRISDLIKHQEDGVPVHSKSRSKKFIKRNDRPYTSLSNKNRNSFDSTTFGNYKVVLDLTPKQEVQQVQDPSKVSKSRALINYSKVYRNTSGDRFKVRRDKHLMNHFALISTQKVVLQQKIKKQKIEIEKLPEKPVSSYRKRRESLKPEASKHRYAQEEQQYQIEGWEYFD